MGNYPKTTNSVPQSINCCGTLLLLDVPKVMGILNITGDSFFDGGRYNTVDMALAQAGKMLEEGADIIDVGGQSTRPGAAMITEKEELDRVLPVIEAIRKTFPQSIISIDTFRAAVAKRAAEAGAAIVNDVSAGDDDALMLETVAGLNVPYIAMHKKGMPQTMQQNPQYDNVTNEVMDYFKAKIIRCEQAGIKDLIVDPGFGFGKTRAHNYTLLAQLESFNMLGKPLLAGVSRKSMIWQLLGTTAEHALNGTTAVNTIALLKGAHILRVHDVKEAREVIAIVQALR